MTEENQKTWDVLLIKGWRDNLYLGDIFHAYESITGKTTFGLLRSPITMAKMPVRAMIKQYLPKLDHELWRVAEICDDKKQEEGYLKLINIVTVSKYDSRKRVVDKEYTKERNKEIRQAKKYSAKMVFNMTKCSERNQATNWNVNK